MELQLLLFCKAVITDSKCVKTESMDLKRGIDKAVNLGRRYTKTIKKGWKQL